MNIITVVVLPERTPIEITNLNIALDLDSFSWAFWGIDWR